MRLIFGFIALLFGCTSIDYRSDVEELMKLHEQARIAHFSKNSKLLVQSFGDQFISVNAGKVDSLTTKEAYERKFQKYFDSVEFEKWDDEQNPSIHFSDDHSLAYMIVDKIVSHHSKDSLHQFTQTTHFAWTAIFRKQPSGEWKLECMTSTNEP